MKRLALLFISLMFVKCEKETYEVPEIIYPKNNKLLTEEKITLYWHKIEGATYYSVIVIKDDSIVINRTSIKDTSFSFLTKEGGNFKWKVGVTYPDKKTLWSDWVKFICNIKYSISSPLLIEPENYSTLKDLTVKFVWSKVNVKNVYYTFHLYEKNNEMKLMYSRYTKDTTLSYTFASNGEFIWKVGVFLEGKSDTIWSDSYAFSIIYEEDDNLLVPVNYLPLIEITFCWKDVGASSHTLQIASDSSFHHIIEEFTTQDTHYLYHPYELSTGTYYWHVIYNFPDGTKKVDVNEKFYVKPYTGDYLLMPPDSMNIYTSARWYCEEYCFDPTEGESEEFFKEWIDTLYLVKLEFDGERWIAVYNDENQIPYSPNFKKVYLWEREFTNPPHDTAFDEWGIYQYKIYYSGDTLILESSFYNEDEWYWWYESWEKISKYVKNKYLTNYFYYYDYTEGTQSGYTTYYEIKRDTMYIKETRPR